MTFELIKSNLLVTYRDNVNASVLSKTNRTVAAGSTQNTKANNASESFDEFLKLKFKALRAKPDYNKRNDELFEAYEYISENELNIRNVQKVHAILCVNLLPKHHLGLIRNNTMAVLTDAGEVEYIATEPDLVKRELRKLFNDIERLLNADLDDIEVFYYAAYLHLVFLKIHPFQDGNGRTARLFEKWFLLQKLGEVALSIPLEVHYAHNALKYYANIREIGSTYNTLDYTQSMKFLMMTINGLAKA